MQKSDKKLKKCSPICGLNLILTLSRLFFNVLRVFHAMYFGDINNYLPATTPPAVLVVIYRWFILWKGPGSTQSIFIFYFKIRRHHLPFWRILFKSHTMSQSSQYHREYLSSTTSRPGFGTTALPIPVFAPLTSF